MRVKIIQSDGGTPVGRLAEAELHFDDGVLAGLKLLGFAIWQSRDSRPRIVTFPARQYSVNGERRSYALLRPINDAKQVDAVKELILAAYAEAEQSVAVE